MATTIVDILNSPVWNFSIWNALEGIGAIATCIAIFFMWWQLKEQQRIKEKPRIQELNDVIIIPLILKLETQIDCIKKGDIGYNNLTGIAEHISRLVSFSPDEKLLYNDFAKEYSEIHKKILEHDEKLKELEKSARYLADKLEEHELFCKKFNEKIKEYNQILQKEDKSDQCIRENERLWLSNAIVEWLVNNKYKLERTHSRFDFWLRYSSEFFDILEASGIKNYKKDFEEKKKEMRFISEDILNNLKEIRDDLTRKYGLKTKI